MGWPGGKGMLVLLSTYPNTACPELPTIAYIHRILFSPDQGCHIQLSCRTPRANATSHVLARMSRRRSHPSAGPKSRARVSPQQGCCGTPKKVSQANKCHKRFFSSPLPACYEALCPRNDVCNAPPHLPPPSGQINELKMRRSPGNKR